jgi:ABC-type sugar transport system permease subunit
VLSLSKLARLILILLAVVLALGLRLRAVERLPIDYDEDDYLRAGQQFATAIQSGDWRAFTELNYRTEHPPLAKIAYGVAIAPLKSVPEIPDRPTTAAPSRTLPQPHLLFARLISALFGVLTVIALALLDPLAAILLATNTWSIKYTSQVMLEALPSLTSLICVLAYMKSKRQVNFWMVLSGISLGLTAASKYMYCIVGIAILIDWVLELRKNRTRLFRFAWANNGFGFFAWAFFALLFFALADPYLWNDPINRLRDSIAYHGGYAQSQAVQDAGFPMWQPFVWLFGSVPWHPRVFIFSYDLFVTLFAFFGLRDLWKKYRVFALWLGLMLAFLLIWTTKWPQYILTVTVPISLAASLGIRATILEPLARWWRNRRTNIQLNTSPLLQSPNQIKSALPYLIPGALVLILLALVPFLYQIAMALTDFSSISIRDGMNGGVLREVWRGLTFQVEPTTVNLFDPSPDYTREVRYAGLELVWQMLTGVWADVMVFNVLWTVLSVITTTILGVGVALLLNPRGVRFKGFWRALFILPWAIPEFVGALVWFQIFDPKNGWLYLAANVPSDVRPAFQAAASWQDKPELALIVLLLAGTWYGFPLVMMATLAGLKMIPRDVYDAAAIDGASRGATFRAITVPLLLPLLAPALILRTIFAFNQFYLFYVMNPPYPLYTLSSLSYFFFNPSYGFGGVFAVSAGINLITVAVLIFLLLRFNKWSRAAEGVTYA